MTDTTRQATVALALRRRIAELETEQWRDGNFPSEARALARALAEFLAAWEAPNVPNAEVLEYGEGRD